MRTYITWIIFLGFVLLCGAETVPKFIASARQESGAVLYVRGAAKQAPKNQTTKVDLKDYQKLVEDMNVNGA